MAIEHINVGASPNDKTGDTLRAAFQKVNANFDELIGSGAEQGAALIPAPVAGLSVADAVLNINSIGELSSLPVPSLRPGRTVVVNVLGYYQPGDGGGGRFYWQGNSNEDDNGGTVFSPSSLPTSGRWKRAIDGDKIMVEWFGAKADYTPLSWTDNTAAVQAALNFASSRRKTVDGNGTFAIAGQLTTTVNMTIMSNGTLKFKKPGTSTHPRIITSSLATGESPTKGTIRVQGVSFEGDFFENPTEEDGRQLVVIVDGEDISVEGCQLYAGRHFGLVVNNAKRARILNNKVDVTCRDGIAVWGCDDVLILGNTVSRTDDNGISCHVTYTQAPKVRTNVKIVYNTLIDNAGAIHTIGGSDILIFGNVAYRSKSFGIQVRPSDGSGHPITAMQSIKVEGNIVHDVLGTTWRVNGNPSSAQAVSPYIIIGTPADSAPSLTENPDGSYYVTQSTIKPMRGVSVRGNTLMRTLAPVPAYSDWGFGEAFVAYSASDGAVFRNSEVKDIDLKMPGIYVYGAIWDSEFSDNYMNTSGVVGFNFVADETSGFDNLYRNVRIRRNSLRGYNRAFDITSVAPNKTYDILIEDNEIDGDPLGVHANRGPSGTWLAAEFPVAFRFVNVTGMQIRRNTLRNLSRVSFGTGSSSNEFFDNLIVCNPVQTGFSTSNAGIGEIPVDPNQYWATIEDCDPASATYGVSLNNCVRSSVGMPSAGKYVAGMFVRSRSLIVGGTAGSQYTVLGWKRLTTGDTHVLGTDWVECRAPTGT